MKRLIILILCTISVLCCDRASKETRHYSLRGTFDKGVMRIRLYTREILPDSLMRFFPTIDKDSALMLISCRHTIFKSFPKVKKTETHPLPWWFSEQYLINDASTYEAIIERIRNKGAKEINENCVICSFDQLYKHIHNNKTLTVDKADTVIFVPDDALEKNHTCTLVFNYNLGETVNNFLLNADANSDYSNKTRHYYSSGITFRELEQSIDYWIIIW